MKKQIAIAALALGIATPAMAQRPLSAHSRSARCTTMAEGLRETAADRDLGYGEQEELLRANRSGFDEDEQFGFRLMVEYVYEQHADESPSEVERSFYRDCMSDNE